ncbi:unnamed protein product, partial [Linum tenue]
MKVLILILRTNNILHFSPQEHYFDCPYQLSSETVSQTYLDAMVSSLEVIEGDIIVMVLMALSTMFVIMGLFPQYANIEMLVMLVSYLFLSSFTGFELRVALRIGSWNTGPRLQVHSRWGIMESEKQTSRMNLNLNVAVQNANLCTSSQ